MVGQAGGTGQRGQLVRDRGARHRHHGVEVRFGDAGHRKGQHPGHLQGLVERTTAELDEPGDDRQGRHVDIREDDVVLSHGGEGERAPEPIDPTGWHPGAGGRLGDAVARLALHRRGKYPQDGHVTLGPRVLDVSGEHPAPPGGR
jgi:hypothetical protein